MPKANFPDDWRDTFTASHWANEQTTVKYIQKNCFTICEQAKGGKNLPESQRALCIFDSFSGQLTDDVLQLLDSNHIDTVFVPANCIDQLQPLDLSVNKDFLRKKFELWYSEQIFEQGVAAPIKFPLHTMKPLGVQWIKEVILACLLTQKLFAMASVKLELLMHCDNYFTIINHTL